jgi:catechol 2,3-dioxygenase-like lactoylglutathione lyase family enzyme
MRPLLLLTVLLSTGSAFAVEIDFTRYLSVVTATTPVERERFVAVPGNARIRVEGPDTPIVVILNEDMISVKSTLDEVPVVLQQSNEITVRATSTTSIRVKQRADVQLNVTSRVHFNTNVSDFARSRDFYGALGFETLSGFPDANTVAMAEAIGIDTPTDYDGAQGGEPGGYLLHGELISIGGFGGGVIDLIEFTIPRNESPPYERINRLGMARAVLHSTDVAADYEHLSETGVEFLSPPTRRTDGSLFVIFRDPDGTFYELTEVPGPADRDAPTHITALGPLNINVSDFERSSAWYRMFGYTQTHLLPERQAPEVARAMGLSGQIHIKGALLTHLVDHSTIELVQWLTPADLRPPYPAPVNHLGIHRTAFSTTDIEADVATLKAQGVEFLSPITPCCSGADSWGSIVAFYDPDGTIVELVEQPFMTVLFTLSRWLSDWLD